LLGTSFGVIGATAWSESLRVSAVPIGSGIQGLGLACYYFAFATPRPLLSRWRRSEQGKYLATVMERDPEVRGDRAGDDLFQAAVRGVGGAVTFVALRPPRAVRMLDVTAATEPRLIGRTVTLGAGLAGRSLQSGEPVMGTPAQCEQDIADAVLPHGERVLVAPIVANARSWGMVVVAQRRGSLFPEDDLEMLGQVARNAATALDHAELIRDRRDEERAAADRRLRQIESRVELMLDSIKDYAMLVLDAAGRVTAWHPGAQHVFGHTRPDIVGQPGSDLYALTPAEFTEWLDEARVWGSARREGRCRRLDGTEFIGTTVIRPLIEEGGGSPGLVVVTHDVTDRRHLEERLRQGQKMEAIGQLAGGVAHDFNNLLTAILGYADWLALELIGDRRREHVAEIQKAADRAAELTRQLLAFSRRQMLQPAALDLNDLVADLLPMLRRLVGARIAIHDETASLMPTIMGDRTQIERVIMNLAVNARDAMPDGGRLTIRTSDVWLDDGWSGGSMDEFGSGPHVLLEVIDTGVGMTAETRRRVFEPFFTTKDVGKGTGLGLSTAYGIVQQMGGAIEVQSEPNGGAQFRVYLPQASEPALTASKRLGPVDVRGGTETVLLVESEDAVRTYLTRLLESHGYQVLPAEDAAGALGLTQTFDGRIDLVISDVVVPGSTGPELVRLLGQRRPGLSAIFMSGHADAAAARHTQSLGADRLLLKPFSSTQLLAKIRQVLAAA
jgi:PAS domain S-box-containing protein